MQVKSLDNWWNVATGKSKDVSDTEKITEKVKGKKDVVCAQANWPIEHELIPVFIVWGDYTPAR